MRRFAFEWLLLAQHVSLSLEAAVRPTYADKPDPLSALNITINGLLRRGRPLASQCFMEPGSTTCSQLVEGLRSPGRLTEQYPGFQNMQGEACLSNPMDQCLIDPITMAPSINSSCRQGVVAPHFVGVTSAEDVMAIVRYALEINTTLSIKNSGHDYMMRSSRRRSLAIWTSALRNTTFHERFVMDGCSHPVTPVAAMTLGAGVSLDEAMRFAHANNVIFPAGNSPFIGASGGWLLNGGHSSLSNSFGLAVDRVVQFGIVTADGELRIANECQNADLFWALRGGGGGAYGVVLESTHRVEPERAVTSLTMFSGPGSTRAFVEFLADNMRAWMLEGWGGVSTTSFSGLVNPLLNLSAAQAMLAPEIAQLESLGGGAQLQAYPSWFDYWAQTVNQSESIEHAISSGTGLASKLVPETVFQGANTRGRLVDAIMDLDAAGLRPTFFSNTPLHYGRRQVNPNTSLNPNWYTSVWHVAVTAAWQSSHSLQQRKHTAALLQDASNLLTTVTGSSGTYANEASPWLQDWALEYWSDHYPKLLAIKSTYDPNQLMHCWHCVGWEPSLPGFECTSDLTP